MIVIGNVLDRFAEADVTLAGFGHEGWEWHPFAAERKLIDSYCATGRVRRLSVASAVSAISVPLES